MNTTIAISPELKDQLKEFGMKGETYEDVIKRLLQSAKERQLQDFLMDTKGYVPVSEALERAKKKMANVVISPVLEEEINARFKGESVRIFQLLLSLQDNPKKGKPAGAVGAIVIKELKYGVYRFYFITDSYKVKFLKAEELKDLLIKFVRMSDKDTQQKTIEEIRVVLKRFGPDGFR